MVTAETAKALLSKHGKTRSQPATDWKGKIPLPPNLEQFYMEVGPSNITIKSHGNPFFLPSLADLWEFQTGYRWNGLDKSPIEGWKDEWLVVADDGGDPFILDTNTNKVLHAYHGEGAWDAGEMFPDLNTMAACLSQIGSLIKEAGKTYVDEDCSITQEFREKVAVRLGELLGSETSADNILGSLGFG